MSELWTSAKGILENQMTPSQFISLFKETTAELQGDTLTIFAGSKFDLEWLDNRHRPLIERAVNNAAKRKINLIFQVKGQEQIKSEKGKDKAEKGKEGREGDNTLEIYGYTPIFDAVADRLGTMTALVFGVVWRHCQMSLGVCTASVARLAGLTGVSESTIRRHLSDLCRAGYLEDTTPDVYNKPHVYKDTGKVRFRVSVQAIID